MQPNKYPELDYFSGTRVKLKERLLKELEDLRRAIEVNGTDLTVTQFYRGRIAEIRNILDWEHQFLAAGSKRVV